MESELLLGVTQQHLMVDPGPTPLPTAICRMVLFGPLASCLTMDSLVSTPTTAPASLGD